MRTSQILFLTLPLAACVETFEEQGNPSVPSMDEEWERPDWGAVPAEDAHAEDMPGEPSTAEAEAQEDEQADYVPLDLTCATTGIYSLSPSFDPDGNALDVPGTTALRMQLSNRDGVVLAKVQSGPLHPQPDEKLDTAEMVLPGSIGGEHFWLDLRNAEVFSGDGSMLMPFPSMDLYRMDTEYILYTGMVNMVRCGDYALAYVSCWEPGFEPEFTYEPGLGVCLNDKGEEGLNQWTVEMARETGSAQCADLSGAQLNDNDWNGPELSWDLRGARLDHSSLYSASLVDARLEGADLGDLYLHSASVQGEVDKFTVLPESCSVEDGTVRCTE